MNNRGNQLLEEVERGRIYVKFMQDARKASDLEWNNIQFNFCLTPNPPISSTKKDIKLAVEAYFKTNNEITSQEKAALLEAIESLPPNASQLQAYSETLSLRAASFRDAAVIILDNSLKGDEFVLAKSILDKLHKAYQDQIKRMANDESRQSCYEAYLDTVKFFLEVELVKKKADIASYLKNAETIANIKNEKALITISGSVNIEKHAGLDANIRLQIEEPRKGFYDLSENQQREWKIACQAYANGIKNQIPPWFKRLATFEKKYWANLVTNLKQNKGQFSIGPVVKKSGIPGLRNLNFSSFATMKYRKNESNPIVSISTKSVRSSNLVVAYKEGTKNLSEDEKRLTDMNVEQVNELYQRNELNKDFPWTYKNTESRQPWVLCQTLVRLAYGGDDHVIANKDKSVHDVQEANVSLKGKMFASNHCIGTPAIIGKAMHLTMHLQGVNTRGIEHVTKPVENFFKDAVGGKFDYHPYVTLSKSGKLSPGFLARNINLSNLVENQKASLTSILLSLNQYVAIEKKPTAFLKRYQLHMAALEEIIYQDTGNAIQSSCKSGKDREGILKCYRNAMRAYFSEYGLYPPAEKNAPGRKEFIVIFIELFNTHHQARLAQLNAAGCEGQKALSSILPSDIFSEMNKELLKQHKKNASLNEMGKSAVGRNEERYNQAKKSYLSLIKQPLANKNSSDESTMQITEFQKKLILNAFSSCLYHIKSQNPQIVAIKKIISQLENKTTTVGEAWDSIIGTKNNKLSIQGYSSTRTYNPISILQTFNRNPDTCLELLNKMQADMKKSLLHLQVDNLKSSIVHAFSRKQS